MYLTSQKIYAALRKAGWGTKNTSSRWPVVSRDSDTHRIWFTVTYESYEGQRSIPVNDRRDTLNRMQSALSMVGISSQFVDEPPQLIVDEMQ